MKIKLVLILFLVIINGTSSFPQNFNPSKSNAQITEDHSFVIIDSTNSNLIIDDLQKLPSRNLEEVIRYMPGVLFHQKNIHIRGTDPNSTNYKLDNFSLTDHYYGGQTFRVPIGALEKISLSTGYKSAKSFGGPNQIGYQIKSMTKNLNAEIDYISDNLEFNSQHNAYSGEKRLGTHWYGYNEINANFGGTIIPKVDFFFNANYLFMRDRNPQAYSGTENIEMVNSHFYNGIDVISDTLNFSYPTGILKNNSSNSFNYLGKVNFDLNPVNISLFGIYQFDREKLNTNPIFNVLNNRVGTFEKTMSQFGISLDHKISEKINYNINLDYFHRFEETFDPYLGTDYWNYGDSTTNANIGATWTTDINLVGYDTFMPISSYFWGFNFMHPWDIQVDYKKVMEDRFSGNIVFNLNSFHNHSISFGGNLQISTHRKWTVNNQKSLDMSIDQMKRTGISITDSVKEQLLTVNNGLNNYGYDILGEETDAGGLYQPHSPITGGIFVEDVVRLNNMVLAIGMRLDYYDFDYKDFKNPSEPETVLKLREIDTDGLEDSKSYFLLNPRLKIDYKFNNKIKAYASYNSYSSLPKLSDLYSGYWAQNHSLRTNSIFFPSAIFPDQIKPVRNQLYEVGIINNLTEHLEFTTIFYYSSSTNLLDFSLISTAPSSPFTDYYANKSQNNNSINKGIELITNLKRYYDFTGQISFLYQDSDKFWNLNNFSTKLLLNYEYNNKSSFLHQLGVTVISNFHDGYNFKTSKIIDPNDRLGYEIIDKKTDNYLQIDLQVNKRIELFNKISANLYLDIINLFDASNYYTVFLPTGSPLDDGWVEQREENQHEFYRLQTEYFARSNNFFAPPRQIRFGIKLDF